MTERFWNRNDKSRPRKDSRVEWITPSGEVVRGTYCGGVVWLPEGSSMYIYYTPVFWRYQDEKEQPR